MSQVTRCPACGTRFKVVADQLRISQGWVRCGVCHEVFDASEDLQPLPAASVHAPGHAADGGAARHDLQPEDEDIREFRESMWLPTAPVGLQGKASLAKTSGPELARAGATASPQPPAAPEPSPPPALPEPAAAPATTMRAEAAAQEQPAASLADELLAAASLSGSAGLPASAASPAEAGTLPPQRDERSDGVLAGGVDVRSERAPAGAPAAQDPQQAAETCAVSVPSPQFSRWPDSEAGEAAAALPEAEPGFVRQARRKAFWRRPAVRAVLLLGSLAGVAVLAGQVMWSQRDALAVQHPALAPTLQALCSLAGCELQPRRQIGDVVIGSSGFRQLPRTGQYQWSLSLENRSDFPVAMPAVELTLTDAQDKLLLRRVIRLEQFGAPAQIEGHGEWSVTAPVEVQGLEAAVAGYRALVFYP
ncbi:MJ0042 family finger-like domain [Delftia tsuruhatensis]|uniref:zinc-ribbon and DUF3426 domain-containing protein n=1 Tax=Delftia tsuruhatensis TaxID=180282 RepID=UPI001E734313|nr:zinc-ribbon and DUF3426 domain-containing protein [Delftia tsuruhatensis]CAB5701701.1 MJ0042 family finger-like domain [Delftia tsuruhatensis]CAC9691467.1 MJ0042 family finger-like domain [Delftia tsuruhatensis]